MFIMVISLLFAFSLFIIFLVIYNIKRILYRYGLQIDSLSFLGLRNLTFSMRNLDKVLKTIVAWKKSDNLRILDEFGKERDSNVIVHIKSVKVVFRLWLALKRLLKKNQVSSEKIIELKLSGFYLSLKKESKQAEPSESVKKNGKIIEYGIMAILRVVSAVSIQLEDFGIQIFDSAEATPFRLSFDKLTFSGERKESILGFLKCDNFSLGLINTNVVFDLNAQMLFDPWNIWKFGLELEIPNISSVLDIGEILSLPRKQKSISEKPPKLFEEKILNKICPIVNVKIAAVIVELVIADFKVGKLSIEDITLSLEKERGCDLISFDSVITNAHLMLLDSSQLSVPLISLKSKIQLSSLFSHPSIKTNEANVFDVHVKPIAGCVGIEEMNCILDMIVPFIKISDEPIVQNDSLSPLLLILTIHKVSISLRFMIESICIELRCIKVPPLTLKIGKICHNSEITSSISYLEMRHDIKCDGVYLLCLEKSLLSIMPFGLWFRTMLCKDSAIQLWKATWTCHSRILDGYLKSASELETKSSEFGIFLSFDNGFRICVDSFHLFAHVICVLEMISKIPKSKKIRTNSPSLYQLSLFRMNLAKSEIFLDASGIIPNILHEDCNYKIVLQDFRFNYELMDKNNMSGGCNGISIDFKNQDLPILFVPKLQCNFADESFLLSAEEKIKVTLDADYFLPICELLNSVVAKLPSFEKRAPKAVVEKMEESKISPFLLRFDIPGVDAKVNFIKQSDKYDYYNYVVISLSLLKGFVCEKGFFISSSLVEVNAYQPFQNLSSYDSILEQFWNPLRTILILENVVCRNLDKKVVHDASARRSSVLYNDRQKFGLDMQTVTRWLECLKQGKPIFSVEQLPNIWKTNDNLYPDNYRSKVSNALQWSHEFLDFEPCPNLESINEIMVTATKAEIKFNYRLNLIEFFDSISLLIKVLENSAKKIFGIPVKNKIIKLPVLHALIKNFYLSLEDDPFEGKLNDIFTINEQQRANEILLETMFWKKVQNLDKESFEILNDKSIESFVTHSEVSKNPIIDASKAPNTLYRDSNKAEAYLKLQESFSASAISRHAKFSGKKKNFVTWSIVNFDVTIFTPPSETSIEGLMQSLNCINQGGFTNQSFDGFLLLLGLFVDLSFGEVRMDFRHYSRSFLKLSGLTLQGPFYVVDLASKEPAWFYKNATSAFLKNPVISHLTVRKSASPTKIYHSLLAQLFGPSECNMNNHLFPVFRLMTLLFGWIDNESSDPSPALFLWEKLKYIMHGNGTRIFTRDSLKMNWSFLKSSLMVENINFKSKKEELIVEMPEGGDLAFSSNGDLVIHCDIRVSSKSSSMQNINSRFLQNLAKALWNWDYACFGLSGSPDSIKIDAEHLANKTAFSLNEIALLLTPEIPLLFWPNLWLKWEWKWDSFSKDHLNVQHHSRYWNSLYAENFDSYKEIRAFGLNWLFKTYAPLNDVGAKEEPIRLCYYRDIELLLKRFSDKVDPVVQNGNLFAFPPSINRKKVILKDILKGIGIDVLLSKLTARLATFEDDLLVGVIVGSKEVQLSLSMRYDRDDIINPGWLLWYNEVDLTDLNVSVLSNLMEMNEENWNEFSIPMLPTQKVLWSPSLYYFNVDDNIMRTNSDGCRGLFLRKIASLETMIESQLIKVNQIDPEKNLEAFHSAKSKVSVLLEKKEMLQSAIVEKSRSFLRQTSTHRFIIQSLNLYWNIPTRNSVMKLIYLNERFSSLKFSLSEGAKKLMKDLLSSEELKASIARRASSPNKQDAMEFMKSLLTGIDEGEEIIAKSEEQGSNKRVSISIPEPDNSVTTLVNGTLFNLQVHLDPDRSNSGLPSDTPIVQKDLKRTKSKTEVFPLDLGSCILVSPRSQVSIKGFMDDSNNYSQWQTKLNIESVEFFVAFKKDFLEWPCFIPLEYLVQYSSASSFKFHKLIEKTNGSIQIVKYKNQEVDDITVRTIVSLQKMVLHVNSQEYCVLYDAIANLLVYNEPLRRVRVEQIDSLLLAMDLFDTESTVETIKKLRRNLGSCNEYLRNYMEKLEKVGYADIWSSDLPAISNIPVERSKIETSFLSVAKRKKVFETELSNLTDAMNIFATRRKASSIYLKTRLDFVCDFIDLCLLDKNEEFCEAILRHVVFIRIDDEDGSATNSLEIAQLSAENKIPSAFYSDLIKPYLGSFPSNSSSLKSHVRDVNFETTRMIRYYSRILAPVGGITVIEHAEINLFPLSIKITKGITQKLFSFFYPAVSVTQKEEKITSSASSNDLKKKTGSDFHEMISRAAENISFIYMKVPGTYHCISYKGDSSISDIDSFLLRLPEFEYRNMTCSWLNLLQEIKKDSIKVVLSNTGSLLKEKMGFGKAKREESSQSLSVSTSATGISSSASTSKKDKDKKVDETAQKARLLFGKDYNSK